MAASISATGTYHKEIHEAERNEADQNIAMLKEGICPKHNEKFLKKNSWGNLVPVEKGVNGCPACKEEREQE